MKQKASINHWVYINGAKVDIESYSRFHSRRIAMTLRVLRDFKAKRIIELGGHPWVMTSRILDCDEFEIASTVSAEEVTDWPDKIQISRKLYRIRTVGKREVTFPNYSANLERTLFDVQENADTVIACEIIEHLLRSPHIMLLNVNRWIPIGGKLFLSTPNGAQFQNPFRRKSARPAFRSNVYARHNYLFTISQLVDLVELCGFSVRKAGFWNPYEAQGLAHFYSILGLLPNCYFKQKFTKTLFLIAEKTSTVQTLSRTPLCYAPSGGWEHIHQNDRNGLVRNEV